MATSYPYISSVSSVPTAVSQLRKNFPAIVDAAWLKKQGLAPNNESYLLGILRFLNVIDKDGKRNDELKKMFAHDDGDFEKEFEGLVKNAYKDLFETYGDQSWNTPKLLTYFRHESGSSDLVGGRQVRTFKTLAALAGHAEIPEASQPRRKAVSSSPAPVRKSAAAPKPAPQPSAPAVVAAAPAPAVVQANHLPFGLGVRVEVILPAGADQATYDSIFRSIRTNLIDATAPGVV